MAVCLSRGDLEGIGAAAVRAYYRAVPPACSVPEPVDPIRLAGRVMGLEVCYFPLSADGSVLGLACFQETELRILGESGVPQSLRLSGREIVIDSALRAAGQTGRHNFTAAHELAHHILARLSPEGGRSLFSRRPHILYRRRRQVRDWGEWQADTLAAAILMPVQTLRHGMYLFGLGDRLDMVSAVCRAREFEGFCNLAAYLGVSKKALAIRMKGLGLLGEEYLAHPAAPLDIWKDEDEPDC